MRTEEAEAKYIVTIIEQLVGKQVLDQMVKHESTAGFWELYETFGHQILSHLQQMTPPVWTRIGMYSDLCARVGIPPIIRKRSFGNIPNPGPKVGFPEPFESFQLFHGHCGRDLYLYIATATILMIMEDILKQKEYQKERGVARFRSSLKYPTPVPAYQGPKTACRYSKLEIAATM